MRIRNIVVEVLSNKVLSASVRLRHVVTGLLETQMPTLHDLLDPELQRGNDTNIKTALMGQHELRTAADVDDFPRPCGHEDHSTEPAHILHLRNGGRIKQVAEHLRDPVGGGFVHEFQHGGRGIVSLGYAFEKFSVENLPADGLADQPCDMAASGPGFSRDGQIRADARDPGPIPGQALSCLFAHATTAESGAPRLR